MVYVIQGCRQLASWISWSSSHAVGRPVWHIPLLCVQWKTPNDGQRNCPRHVEFYSKNKFEKLVHQVGFTIRIDCWEMTPCRLYGYYFSEQPTASIFTCNLKDAGSFREVLVVSYKTTRCRGQEDLNRYFRRCATLKPSFVLVRSVTSLRDAPNKLLGPKCVWRWVVRISAWIISSMRLIWF